MSRKTFYLKGIPLSGDAWEFVILNLVPADEPDFLQGWADGCSGARMLEQKHPYSKGFWFGARYCSICQVQGHGDNYFSLVPRGNGTFARVCSSCKEGMVNHG